MVSSLLSLVVELASCVGEAASDAVNVSGAVNAGAGTVDIDANTDGAGAQGFNMRRSELRRAARQPTDGIREGKSAKDQGKTDHL